MTATLVSGLACALVLLACGAPPPEGAPSSPAPTAAAEDDALCPRHGVLQSLCTKCEPSLAVVFQNKGDWCAEHELPESICPVCHPERGGRPALDVTHDEAPPDGIEVRLASTIVAPAIGLAVVPARPARAELEVEAFARIDYDPARHARVSAPIPGTLSRVLVADGRRVARGEVLAHLVSGELGDRQARIAGARASVRLARQTVDRVARLTAQGATSTQALDDARAALVERQAELAATLAQVDALRGERAHPAATDTKNSDVYALSSPIDGIVLRFEARVGIFVEPGQTLFEVVDPTFVWAELEVPEADAHLVADGQPVSLRFDGFPDSTWHGPLTALSPEVDPHTRSVRARVVLDNAEQRLRKNLWGRATITVPRMARLPVLVPRGSVQVARGASLVFVRRRGDLYEGRRVEPGRSHGDWIEVTGRLDPGEEVVVDGAYLLKTETLRDAIGAGCCDHGPGVR